MNRVVSTNLEQLSSAVLPPARTGPRSASEPVRMLFITTGILGFTTLSRQLEAHTAPRPDIDATHIILKPGTLLKALAKSVPISRGLDMQPYRYLLATGALISRWCRAGGPLDLARFDLLHITTQGIARTAAGLARRAGIPHAIHIDATGISEVRDFGRAPGANSLFIRAERRIYRDCPLISAMTEWACDSLRDDYRVPAERIVLARASVKAFEIARGGGGGGGAPRPARTEGGPCRLVFVGNDWDRKGGPRLVRWHQARWKDRAELHVFSSKAPKDLQASCTNVFIHGPVPREKLLGEVLPSMDLIVLPTREDTVVWALIEACGVGVPAVASRLAGIPEVVLDGKTGLLCDRFDDGAFIAAVERLMNDEPLRRSMSAAAREHIAASFDPGVWYNALLDRLVALARTHPVPGARA